MRRTVTDTDSDSRGRHRYLLHQSTPRRTQDLSSSAAGPVDTDGVDPPRGPYLNPPRSYDGSRDVTGNTGVDSPWDGAQVAWAPQGPDLFVSFHCPVSSHQSFPGDLSVAGRPGPLHRQVRLLVVDTTVGRGTTDPVVTGTGAITPRLSRSNHLGQGPTPRPVTGTPDSPTPNGGSSRTSWTHPVRISSPTSRRPGGPRSPDRRSARGHAESPPQTTPSVPTLGPDRSGKGLGPDRCSLRRSETLVCNLYRDPDSRKATPGYGRRRARAVSPPECGYPARGPGSPSPLGPSS